MYTKTYTNITDHLQINHDLDHLLPETIVTRTHHVTKNYIYIYTYHRSSTDKSWSREHPLPETIVTRTHHVHKNLPGIYFSIFTKRILVPITSVCSPPNTWAKRMAGRAAAAVVQAAKTATIGTNTAVKKSPSPIPDQQKKAKHIHTDVFRTAKEGSMLTIYRAGRTEGGGCTR